MGGQMQTAQSWIPDLKVLIMLLSSQLFSPQPSVTLAENNVPDALDFSSFNPVEYYLRVMGIEVQPI